MSKEDFNNKWSHMKNARNTTSGLVNSKNMTYSLGHNKYSGMLIDDFKEYMGFKSILKVWGKETWASRFRVRNRRFVGGP